LLTVNNVIAKTKIETYAV